MELIDYLKRLESLTVMESIAGGGAGSILKTSFGPEPEASRVAFFIYCTWRIEDNGKVICTSSDNIEPITGLIAKSARSLEGRVVQSVEMSPQYDVIVKFMDGYCLRIFCNFSYTSEVDTNWEFWVPYDELAFEISNTFEIREGKYS